MINVLPQKEKTGLRREYYLRLATVSLVIITFVAVFACILLLPPYMVSTSKEISLEKQLIQMNETNQNLSLADINVFIGKVNTTLALFDSKNPSRNVYQNIFMPVLEARPKSITISQFLYADRGASAGATLGLHGIATDRAALQSFKKILEDTGKFTSVDVPISNFVKRTNIDFTLTLFIK